MIKATLSEQKAELRLLVPVFAVRVAPVYRLLGWEWGEAGEVSAHIPTEEQITEALYRLIDSLTEENWKYGSGGLSVYWDDVNGVFGLQMVTESNGYFNPGE